MDFKDIIKVVYSWIGPKGPIWNTELPNILSFCGVSEGAQSRSHYYWADDLWQKIFRFRKEGYVLYPVFEVDEKDIFIYPYSLAWRVPFTSYFLGNTGILEFSHCPGHVIYHVRNHKGFILIDASVEAWMQNDQLLSLHNYFRNIHHLPLNKIIYVTGCMNADEIYRSFKELYEIPDDPENTLNIISYPSSYTVFSVQLNGDGPESFIEPEYDPEYLPEKLFLAWNRRYRPHRHQLALGLDKAGLVDRSYYSMGAEDPETPILKFSKAADIHHNPYLNLTQEDLDNFVKKLPLVLDNQTNVNEMCEDNGHKARNFYTNSLISLITETNFDLPEVTLTEKSFKPAKEKHPFILVGVNGSLKAMREAGFKTFNEFWSEEYDNIEDHRFRMAEIIRVCQEIGTWDEDKIKDFRRKVKPILEHNYLVLKKNPSDVISEKISNVVRRNI